MSDEINEPIATSESSKKIGINKETVHHICSGQVRSIGLIYDAVMFSVTQ